MTNPLTQQELERIRDYTISDTAQRLLDTVTDLQAQLSASREAVCPTCTGTCAVIIGENEFNTCPDCHGTGKRMLEGK